MFKKFCLFLFCILILTGCSNPTVKKSAELAIYDNMVNRSLLFEGNTSRIKEKLHKAKKGEKVVIAYLGGSITNGAEVADGKGYAPISFNKIKDFIGKKANLEYINAAYDGTSSILGNTIADKEVLSKKADIIFIEYAVNDRPEQIYRAAFESLIRTCLNNKNNPAVILILTCTDKGVSRQDFMTQIGKYYNLPVIAVANAVQPEISAARMKPDEYFQDIAHPTEYGHRLMADFIMNYIKKAYKTKSKDVYVVPSKMYPKSTFENVKFISAKNIHADNDGSFIRKETKNKLFPEAVEYLTNTGNKPFEFTITANNIFLVAPKCLSEVSNADIYINSQKTMTINLARNGKIDDIIQAFLIYSSDKTEPVKVSIKIPEEENINFAEPENNAEPQKSDENSISESNFPEEEKVTIVTKKNKTVKNTIPFTFYGIGYTKNTDGQNNRGK